MQTAPHLHFKGNCAEAFRFYADTFGGKIVFSMTYGESPAGAQTPADFRDKIIHARLDFGGAVPARLRCASRSLPGAPGLQRHGGASSSRMTPSAPSRR